MDKSKRPVSHKTLALLYALIHPSAWNKNSRKLNFRFTAFSEVLGAERHPGPPISTLYRKTQSC